MMDQEVPEAAPSVRVSLRLDWPGGGRVGPGKIRLLAAIAETGSIAAAARRLGMSYRRAWSLADAMNALFIEPVVTRQSGGPKGGGAALTLFGVQLLALYRQMENVAHAVHAEPLALLASWQRPLPILVAPGGENGPTDDQEASNQESVAGLGLP
jgi:molybdate transport system regulatory protein